MVDSINEKRLLTELKNGSFQAFERLYNMYSGKLYNFHYANFFRQSIYGWRSSSVCLYTCLGSTWASRAGVFIYFFSLYHRQEFINEYVSASDCRVCLQWIFENTGVDRDSQTEESIDLRFLNEYIDSLAEELPAQRKKIFILSKRQNYTNKEIAEMMGISESTVATQLSLAVKFMREQLMKHYDKIVALLFAFFC